MAPATNDVALREKDILTQGEILQMAAEEVGLLIRHYKKNLGLAHSNEFVTKTVDRKFLRFLADRNIKAENRSDGVFTLVDRNHQEPEPGFLPSNFWNFIPPSGNERTNKFEIHLYTTLRISKRERGVVIMPATIGGGLSPADHLPTIRMFRAVVESGIEVPEVAQRISKSETGFIIVHFSELGLGGLRTTSELFAEFASGRPLIAYIAQNRVVKFDPPAFTGLGDEPLYAREPIQPKIMDGWKKQLREFQYAITLP